jgi:hypothetical protein
MPGCQNANAIPPTLSSKAVGRVTPESSARMVATGGQVCYVELTNQTLHATPLTLRFYSTGPTGETDLCSSTFLMKPLVGSKLVFTWSVFGTNITWRVEVATSMDVDVADVRCAMFC